MTYWPGQITVLFLGLFCIGAVSYYMWTLYERKQQANNPVKETPLLWTPPLVHHHLFGTLQTVKYDPESHTTGLHSGIDDRGRVHSWPGSWDEFTLRNKEQALYGGRAEFDFIESKEAEEVGERYSKTVTTGGKIAKVKRELEEATTEAKLARVNTKGNVREIVGQINEGAKARAPQRKEK